MPVRAIPKNYRHITGVNASPTAIGPAEFEAGLERSHLILLEFDPRVARFEVQPVRIPWKDKNGKNHIYTPDCMVWFTDELKKPHLLEVKYRSDLKKELEEMRLKYRAAFRYSRLNGLTFHFVTEKEIRTQFLESARFLLPFVRGGIRAPQHKELFLRLLMTLRRATPNALLSAATTDLTEQAYLLPSLWFLIGTFQIGADLWQPLSMDMEIWSLR